MRPAQQHVLRGEANALTGPAIKVDQYQRRSRWVNLLGTGRGLPRDVVRGPAASPATRGTSSPARMVLARCLRPVWILPLTTSRGTRPTEEIKVRHHQRRPNAPRGMPFELAQEIRYTDRVPNETPGGARWLSVSC